jgi:hypothetical protein
MLKIPKFATEAEEAKWWFENDEMIGAEFEKAAKEGRVGRGGARRLLAEKGIPFPEPPKSPEASSENAAPNDISVTIPPSPSAIIASSFWGRSRCANSI